jgi:cytochrome c-type biogenesis protein CcmF
MPWLAATAYLHSVMVQEKRDMLKVWNFVLIGLTYGLCLFGTMITRAGLVQSVHAFAQTEIFGVLFAWYVGLAFVAFTAALLYRVPALRSPNKLESIVSREASFVINNWLFMGLLAIVLWGPLPALRWSSGRPAGAGCSRT